MMKLPSPYNKLKHTQWPIRVYTKCSYPIYRMGRVLLSGSLCVFFLLLKKCTLGLGEPTLYPYTLKKLTSDSVKVLLMAVIGLRFSLTVSAKQR